MTRTVSNPRLPQPGNGGTVKRFTLADCIKGGKQLPSRLVFQAVAGAGKTTFATFSPNPFFLLSPGETGLHTLADQGLVSKDVQSLEILEWENLFSVIEELQTTNHDRKTLVLDAIDGFEKLGNKYVCDKDYGGDWSTKGFLNYQVGYRSMAMGPWKHLLQELDHLRELKRMAIILLAHSGISNFSNPAGADYNRFTPPMYKDAWEITFGWADIVLFGNRETTVKKEKADTKAKASGGRARIMYTEYDAIADAKNRHNLPAEIDMGSSGQEAWNNFIEAIKAGKNGGKAAE